MTEDKLSTSRTEPAREKLRERWQRVVRRRSFLKDLGVAGAAVPAGALLTTPARAYGDKLSAGDTAILRFLAAAEIIETDLCLSTFRTTPTMR